MDANASADGNETTTADGTINNATTANVKANDVSLDDASTALGTDIKSAKSGTDASALLDAVGVENGAPTSGSNVGQEDGVNGSAATIPNGTAGGSS